MKATFENTVDILVKAYMNGTLSHGQCKACAVGNIIAANGYKFCDNSQDEWLKKIITEHRDGGYIYDDAVANDQINHSGYNLFELHRIEQAFERCDYGATPEEWMFNGLMAVVDVLAEIHSIDLSQ